MVYFLCLIFYFLRIEVESPFEGRMNLDCTIDDNVFVLTKKYFT